MLWILYRKALFVVVFKILIERFKPDLYVETRFGYIPLQNRFMTVLIFFYQHSTTFNG